MMSNEDYELKIKFYINKIKKNKELDQKKRIERFTAENSHKHWQGVKSMLQYLFLFLLGDVVILLMQLRISNTYDQTSVNQMITKTYFKHDIIAEAEQETSLM